jgi:hypothetical protein
MPRAAWPVAMSTIPAGTQTMRVPTAGMSDERAVIAPKKMGSGTPAIA